MRLQIILVGLVIGLIVCALPSAAQRGGKGSGGGYSPLQVPGTGATAGQKYKGYLYGVVKELSKDQMVLTKTDAGYDETFKFNKKTKFMQDGKDSSLESLKLGDKVWVDANTDKKTGELTAKKVVTGVFFM